MSDLEKVAIVCGGRGFTNYPALCLALDKCLDVHNFNVVRHGAASGADTLADKWARSKGIKTDPCPAQWKKYGKSAGYKRNYHMATKLPLPSLVIAFPGGVGTNMMKEIACKHNIHLITVDMGNERLNLSVASRSATERSEVEK